MLKYDYNKILDKLKEKQIRMKELIENPNMYRWNENTIIEVLIGQRPVSERFAKDIEKSTGISITEFFSDEYISTNQPNYSREKLFDFMSKNGINTKEIEQKMHLKDNQVWEIIVGKEIFTKSIAKYIRS